MAPFTRKNSKKDKAKKTAKKAAKGVAIVQVAKRTPKRWIPIVGAAVAALVATKIVRGRHGDPAAA
jgi:hypothetical protein